MLLTALLISVSACEKKEEGPSSSFELIQSRIMTPSCAIPSCHASEADATFNEHHLILKEGASYENLVDAAPINANALADGLLRVKPNDAEASLLLHKIHIEDHHASDYGNPMPLGLQKLSAGQVEYIRQWIDAGAPKNGFVADAALMDDVKKQEEEYVPLPPPPNGTGFQVNINPFTIAPNFEREIFIFKPVGNSLEVFVNRFEVKMRPNSHHLVVYDFEVATPPAAVPDLNVIRDLRNPDNSLNIATLSTMSYHTFIFGCQSPYMDYQFPPGVALRIPAGMKYDFNSHYANREPQSISGEVNMNFYTVDPGTVTQEAHTLYLSNTNIQLNPGEQKTIVKTFVMSSSVSVLSVTSHTHELGNKFVIKIVGGPRNGEIIYTNTDWHHPPFVTFDPPIQLAVGQGLASEVTYKNTRNQMVGFGLTSMDEMGIIFGYFTEN